MCSFINGLILKGRISHGDQPIKGQNTEKYTIQNVNPILKLKHQIILRGNFLVQVEKRHVANNGAISYLV